MKYTCTVCERPSDKKICSDAFCGANCKPVIVPVVEPTREEIDAGHEVICYLHKGEGDKSNNFVKQKFGEHAFNCARKVLQYAVGFTK